uniref:Uncharacterized protein n=1 Tax=Strigamia maritima TaxID=126957 RepID=T1II27_STRMM
MFQPLADSYSQLLETGLLSYVLTGKMNQDVLELTCPWCNLSSRSLYVVGYSIRFYGIIRQACDRAYFGSMCLGLTQWGNHGDPEGYG